ncbi:MAG: hypothetical protein OXI96_01870 [Acidimicrobiaceae bacterium]|nr:hypothetical protein [Acidimicrobiaceae bacterium]
MTLKHLVALVLLTITWAVLPIGIAHPGAAQSDDNNDNSETTSENPADANNEEDPDPGENTEENAIIENYYPCAPEQDVDILAMFDASGSLNQPRGIDPDGTYRRTALNSLRNIASPTENDQASDAGDPETAISGAGTNEESGPEVRLSLYYFHTEAVRVTEFLPMSPDYPSEESIEETLQVGNYSGRNTNYINALKAVISAFSQLEENENQSRSCRILLFFTDGIYDPDGRVTQSGLTENTANEIADQLREQVCVGGQTITSTFRELGIQTYAVLLEDAFLELFPDSGDEVNNRSIVAAASIQALRKITADIINPFSEKIEDHPSCFVDSQLDEQNGQIITLRELDNLEFALVEIITAAIEEETMLTWQTCATESPDELTRRSDPLPNSQFIEAIAVYPTGGRITEYRLNSTADAPWRALDRQGYLQLNWEEHLQDLPAGWTLEFRFNPGRRYTAEEVAFRCYAAAVERVSEPLELVVLSVEEEGSEIAAQVYQTPEESPHTSPFQTEYTLALRAKDSDKLIDICHMELEFAKIVDPFADTEIEIELAPCGRGANPRLTNYIASCGASFEQGKHIGGYVKPNHMETMFPEFSNVRLSVITAHASSASCPEAPQLVSRGDECSQLEIPNSGSEISEVSDEPIKGSISCFLQLPGEGDVNIKAEWIPNSTSEPITWTIGEVNLAEEVVLTPLNPHFPPNDSPRSAQLNYQDLEMTFSALLNQSDALNEPLQNSLLLPFTLTFVTEESLNDDIVDADGKPVDWNISGDIQLEVTWETENPLYSQESLDSIKQTIPLPVSATFFADELVAAPWIAPTIVLIASFIFSYVLMCRIISSYQTLPNPKNFWAYSMPLRVSRDTDTKKLSVISDADNLLLENPGALRIKTQKTGFVRGNYFKQLAADTVAKTQLLLDLKRGDSLNLFRLLAGAWTKIVVSSNFVGTNRPTPKSATSSISFPQLTVVELQSNTPNDPTLDGWVWFLEPKKGSGSGRTQVPLEEVQKIVDGLSEEMAGDGSAKSKPTKNPERLKAKKTKVKRSKRRSSDEDNNDGSNDDSNTEYQETAENTKTSSVLPSALPREMRQSLTSAPSEPTAIQSSPFEVPKPSPFEIPEHNSNKKNNGNGWQRGGG